MSMLQAPASQPSPCHAAWPPQDPTPVQSTRSSMTLTISLRGVHPTWKRRVTRMTSSILETWESPLYVFLSLKSLKHLQTILTRTVEQVSIKLADTPKAAGQSTKNPRPGVRSLPANVRRSFSEDFIPSVLEEVGWSTTPWQNLGINTLQICINQVYPTLGYVVEKGDAIDSSVSSPSIWSANPSSVFA